MKNNHLFTVITLILSLLLLAGCAAAAADGYGNDFGTGQTNGIADTHTSFAAECDPEVLSSDTSSLESRTETKQNSAVDYNNIEWSMLMFPQSGINPYFKLPFYAVKLNEEVQVQWRIMPIGFGYGHVTLTAEFSDPSVAKIASNALTIDGTQIKGLKPGTTKLTIIGKSVDTGQTFSDSAIITVVDVQDIEEE